MRILGFMILLTLGIANITLARRLPPKNMPGGLFNMTAFKIPAFTLYCVANIIAFMGIYTGLLKLDSTAVTWFILSMTVLTFIDISAINVGVPENFSFYLVSLVNAGGGVGRLMTGVMVDRWGKFILLSLGPCCRWMIGAINVITPMTVAVSIMTFSWPYAKSKGSFVTVAVLYG
jgi:MCP family monocarboxylic acid transporter-like MFS transporter 10